MIRNKVVGWMTLVLLGLATASAFGEQKSAADLYGSGVHAYFAGDYARAITLLTQAIQKKDTDPRPYFFRGLALGQTKGVNAGAADFAKGADLEVNGGERKYNINVALQRVQGPLRLVIEKQRAATRKAAAERKKKRDLVRYEQLKRREAEVLYDPNRPAPKVDISLPQPAEGAPPDPFASGAALTGGKLVNYTPPDALQPEVEETPAGVGEEAKDPFAAQGSKAATKEESEPADPFATPGKSDNPFGEMKPAPKVEEEPPAGNPFGEDAKPAGNPFGEGAPVAAPPGGLAPGKGAIGSVLDVLGKTLSGNSADRDPFGDSKSDEGAKKAPPSSSTPPADDPFGDTGSKTKEPEKEKPAVGEKPKNTPPADDPFK